ncbi:unnamed protein product [Symbiodinium pilosum]|uniref:Uncharacterized protein n=1 Tax=Symbiodinium pilosum TaxID=2952 RepID=A0A812XGK8_SYMPI|nr:unnamed protein product [Symbiodinium pilosum]
MAMLLRHVAVLVLASVVNSVDGVRTSDGMQASADKAVTCQCRTVEDYRDCPVFEDTSDPRYYHADVDGAQMCCRLTQGGLLGKMSMNYKTQPSSDLCMEEERPMSRDMCCMLKGGVGFRIQKARASNWATRVKEDERTWEDYTSKTQLSFEIEDISAGHHDRQKVPLDRVQQYVKNYLAQTDDPQVCAEVKHEPLWEQCDLRPRGSPECCCHPESFKAGAQCLAVGDVHKPVAFNVALPPHSELPPLSVQRDLVSKHFAPFKKAVARDPIAGVKLIWHLHHIQWERHQCVEWNGPYCQKMQWYHPTCQKDNELLFVKDPAVKIPDTMFQCPSGWVSDKETSKCKCREYEDKENVALWNDMIARQAS